jgi:hypothetical protein
VNWSDVQKHSKVTLPADHKLKHEAVNAQFPSVINYSALVWYFDGITSVDERTIKETPGKFNLDQNYPNPFNTSTIIR